MGGLASCQFVPRLSVGQKEVQSLAESVRVGSTEIGAPAQQVPQGSRPRAIALNGRQSQSGRTYDGDNLGSFQRPRHGLRLHVHVPILAPAHLPSENRQGVAS